jgi:hypothetical protein
LADPTHCNTHGEIVFTILGGGQVDSLGLRISPLLASQNAAMSAELGKSHCLFVAPYMELPVFGHRDFLKGLSMTFSPFLRAVCIGAGAQLHHECIKFPRVAAGHVELVRVRCAGDLRLLKRLH